MDGEAYEIERKFLIRFPDMELLRSRATGSEIVQTYLLCPEKGCTARVRKRGWPGSYRYTHTVKTRISDLRRLEQEREERREAIPEGCRGPRECMQAEVRAAWKEQDTRVTLATIWQAV